MFNIFLSNLSPNLLFFITEVNYRCTRYPVGRVRKALLLLLLLLVLIPSIYGIFALYLAVWSKLYRHYLM